MNKLKAFMKKYDLDSFEVQSVVVFIVLVLLETANYYIQLLNKF